MKIQILKDVRLNIDGKGLIVFSPSSSIIEIDSEYAKKENLQKRYAKFPKYIKILEENTEDKESESNKKTKKRATKKDK